MALRLETQMPDNVVNQMYYALIQDIYFLDNNVFIDMLLCENKQRE
jgi:hypothetical protein